MNPDLEQLGCPLNWEADHQQTILKAHGLAEEFPYGCDAIDHVAEALIAQRIVNEELQRGLQENSEQIVESARTNEQLKMENNRLKGVLAVILVSDYATVFMPPAMVAHAWEVLHNLEQSKGEYSDQLKH